MHLNLAWLILFLWTGSVLLREERLLRTVLVSLLTSTSLMTLGSLVGLPGFRSEMGRHSYTSYGVRTGALGWELNFLGVFLSVVALVAIGLLLDRVRWKRWKRVLLLGSMVLALALLIRTGSRGGLLSFVVASTLYLLPLGRRGRRIAAIVLGIVTLVGVGYLVASDPMSVRRWTKTYTQGDTAGRDRIFAATWNMFRDRPVLGWGSVEVYYELGSRLNLPIRGPHNLYLGLLAEGGIVGALPFLVGLWLCTRAAWGARAGRFGVLPLALQIGMLVGSLSLGTMYERQMWFVLAVAIGTGTAKRLPPAVGHPKALAPTRKP